MEGYHFGGYAKSDVSLEQFMDEFQKESSLPLEHIYHERTNVRFNGFNR